MKTRLYAKPSETYSGEGDLVIKKQTNRDREPRIRETNQTNMASALWFGEVEESVDAEF